MSCLYSSPKLPALNRRRENRLDRFGMRSRTPNHDAVSSVQISPAVAFNKTRSPTAGNSRRQTDYSACQNKPSLAA
jgi:hypothetical protein